MRPTIILLSLAVILLLLATACADRGLNWTAVTRADTAVPAAASPVVAAQTSPTSVAATGVAPNPTATAPAVAPRIIAPKTADAIDVAAKNKRTMTPVTVALTGTPVPPTAIIAASPSVVYFFFSTSCSYCAGQAPIMEQFHQDNPTIKVVGIPLYASQAGAESFASEHGLTFQIREDKSLVNTLGAVTNHPVIAFQGTAGGPLTRASEGKITQRALTESFRTFVGGRSITTLKGSG